MPKFKRGDKVWYVPDHADDASHPDAEAGVVVEVLGPKNVSFGSSAGVTNYRVNYNDGSGVAKLTYERDLQKRDSNNE